MYSPIKLREFLVQLEVMTDVDRVLYLEGLKNKEGELNQYVESSLSSIEEQRHDTDLAKQHSSLIENCLKCIYLNELLIDDEYGNDMKNLTRFEGTERNKIRVIRNLLTDRSNPESADRSVSQP